MKERTVSFEKLFTRFLKEHRLAYTRKRQMLVVMRAVMRFEMSIDIPANEKNRLLSDLYCTTYTITKSGLIKVLCKPEMMSRVARLMHMQLVSTSSAAKCGIVYFACKRSGCFVDMSYEIFARVVQVTFGASLMDHKDKLISPKTISNGITIAEITFPHLDIRISRLLEDNATPADRAAHIDLADWILKYLETDNN